MSAKVLIVEDEFLIGMEMEYSLQESGYEVIGIAADFDSAVELAERGAEIALVDVNLRDGPTGPQIARKLGGENGMTIVFITANPRQIVPPVPGALGIIAKPTDNMMVVEAVDYAAAVRAGREAAAPPPLMPLAA